MSRSRLCRLLVLVALIHVVARAPLLAQPSPPAAPTPATSPILDPAQIDDPSRASVVATEGSDPNAILRAQVHLDRARFAVGEIDGRYGDNTRRAIVAFQRAHDLDPNGTVDAATWTALAATAPTLVSYTITQGDVTGPFVSIPSDMMEKAKLKSMAYSSSLEAIAERAHASPALLTALNPGKSFDKAGETVLLPNVNVEPPPAAASIEVDANDLSVRTLDDAGRILARYPASVGSEHDPLPVGRWTIKGIARNPPFNYNPDLFWDAKASHDAATIPPGPNNPVGVVWIDLSKEHYGIHGTPEPSRISRSESHGCIRLTNWNAAMLADQVRPGTPAILMR